MRVKQHHGPLSELTPDILHNMKARGCRYFAAICHSHVMENGRLGNCFLATAFKTESEAVQYVDSQLTHRYNQVFSEPEFVPEVLEGNHFITIYIELPADFVI